MLRIDKIHADLLCERQIGLPIVSKTGATDADFIRNLDFDQPIEIRHGLARGMNKNLQQRGRRMVGTINDRCSKPMPSAFTEEPASTGQIGEVGNAP